MCAGYALYGSATMVVLSLGKESGVNGFMLDPVSLFLLANFCLIKGLSSHYLLINFITFMFIEA